MWRNTGEWERKKWYLIRSLFDDAPILSPIPEAQEIPIEPSSPTEKAFSRPYSPLPELVIKKEPNRHDESEEYYKTMERRVMKYYRKLFNDEQSSESLDFEGFCADRVTSVTFINSEDEDTNNISDLSSNLHASYVFDIIKQPRKKSSKELESSAHVEEEEANDEESENHVMESNISSSENSSTPRSESPNNEIIITQALVHHARSEKIEANTALTDTENHDATSEQDRMAGDFMDSNESDEEEEELANSSNNEESTSKFQNFSFASRTNSEPDEPEIMRRRKTRHDSLESIYDLNIALSSDNSLVKSADIASGREMEDTKRPSSNLGSFKEIASEISSCRITSPRKRKIDHECSWQDIKTNFFIGSPRIFKLCSCPNHVCC